MLDQPEQPMPNPPPEGLTPETKQQIVRFVNEGVARPWYAPKPNSTDGDLILAGISMPAVDTADPDEFVPLPNDGMDRIGEGTRYLVISTDGNMSVIATPHKELQNKLEPNGNPSSVNYVEDNIWTNRNGILPEIEHGNATMSLRSFIETEKAPLIKTVEATFGRAERTIAANKPSQSTTPLKLA